MDRNNLIGFILIFAITLGYFYFNSPSKDKLAKESAVVEDSTMATAAPTPTAPLTPAKKSVVEETLPQDSAARAGFLQSKYGVFAGAGQGSEQFVELENEEVIVKLSTKGGRIVSVFLKKYKKLLDDSAHNHIQYPLYLLNNPNNKWQYFIPYKGAPSGFINTGELYFTPSKSGNTVTMTATGQNGIQFVQTYKLGEHFDMDYNVSLKGADQILPPGEQNIQFHWENYVERVEQNTKVEKQYSTLYYKTKDGKSDYLKPNDEEEVMEPIDWVSSTNQFFNTSLLSDLSHPFSGGLLQTETPEDDPVVLTIHRMTLKMPVEPNGLNSSMKIFSGPNVFETLRAYDRSLEDIVPFGWGIFGTVNRWLIRPLFNFIASWIGSFGLAILILTLMVKLALSPLNYKMIHSQSKMSALKPVIAKLKDKYKDDSQTLQMETMKIYREYGVNPLGGCMPMLLQLPIWIALYRFFPASIDFRQQPFLWAHDLSSYDALFYLPTNIPFIGDHISLFTVLWVVTTLIYTYYNSKVMDMSSMGNPSMKYMQYIMPVMFLGFFNNYASGLTAYLFISNLFNIGQTLFIKNVLIDHDKIKQELKRNKEKPKKKTGFAAKFEQAMKEQQRAAEQRKKKK